MNMGIRIFTVVSIGAFCVLASETAAATVVSQANLYSTLFDNVTVGGNDVPVAEISRSATATPAAGITQSVDGWSYASAHTGRLAFTLTSSITMAADAALASQTSAAIQSTNNMAFDDFTIGPGIGPGGTLLSLGDAALVSMQTRLDAQYQYQGRPSSVMMLDYSMDVRQSGVLTNLVDFNSGNILPVTVDEIHQLWSVLVPVTVGETLTLEARMSGWVGGSAFDQGESGTNYLYADPLFRISNAPGYDLDIVSAAGAPISPIPLPAAAWLFLSGFSGLLFAASRRSSEGAPT